jgi:hypothetical protein
MTTIHLHSDGSPATITDEDPPGWERFKLYRLGTMLARKTGETHQRCQNREIHMTRHCLQLESGQRIRVCWRDFVEWAVIGQAQKVHLRRPESIHYAKMAEARRIEWPDALGSISELGPIAEDLEDASAPEESLEQAEEGADA